LAAVGNLEVAPTRGQDKAGLLEVDLRSCDAVAEARLPTAGEEFLLFSLRQLEIGSEAGASLSKRMLLAVSGEPKHGQQKGLEIRDPHARSVHIAILCLTSFAFIALQSG